VVAAGSGIVVVMPKLQIAATAAGIHLVVVVVCGRTAVAIVCFLATTITAATVVGVLFAVRKLCDRPAAAASYSDASFPTHPEIILTLASGSRAGDF
jgi:hypothetical protein